jgi:hypothetical protein
MILDPRLVAEARRATGEKTATAVVNRGLHELIRQARRARLRSLFGNVREPIEPPRRRRPR